MGQLRYNRDPRGVTIDDRALAHLQVAMNTKLRRGEGFFFSWSHNVALGDTPGRTSIWIGPASTLSFQFSGGRPPALNPAWLEVMARAGYTSAGLYVMTEPPQVLGDDVSPNGRVS